MPAAASPDAACSHVGIDEDCPSDIFISVANGSCPEYQAGMLAGILAMNPPAIG